MEIECVCSFQHKSPDGRWAWLSRVFFFTPKSDLNPIDAPGRRKGAQNNTYEIQRRAFILLQ